MSYKLKIYFENGFLDLIAKDEIQGESLEYANDIFVRGLNIWRTEESGKIVSYEAYMLDRDYKVIMEDLGQNSIETHYDVPELGLTDATITEVLNRCYDEFVLKRKTTSTKQL